MTGSAMAPDGLRSYHASPAVSIERELPFDPRPDLMIRTAAGVEYAYCTTFGNTRTLPLVRYHTFCCCTSPGAAADIT